MSKLKDLFVTNEADIYGKFTAKTSDVKWAQPFIERRPNSPDRDRYENDSRALPIGSSRDQIERIGKYLISPSGVSWLVKQRLLRAQSARPDLKSGIGLGLTEGALSAEILASLAPPVRGERYGSRLFGLVDERYSKSRLTTALGSDLNRDQFARKRGMDNGYDDINSTTILDGPPSLDVHRTARKDSIPFYFTDVVNKKVVFFRATVNGVNESVSPEWNSTQYIGRPFKNYSYNGVERTVNFSFTIYPTNANDVITNYTRYNYLVGLTFPAGYIGTDRTSYSGDLAAQLGLSAGLSALSSGGFIRGFSVPGLQTFAQNIPGYIQPPFVKFTLGNLYYDQPAIITSINMTVPDESAWEIGGSKTKGLTSNSGGLSIGSILNRLKKLAIDQLTGATGRYPQGQDVPGIDGFKLPHILQINMNLTLIEKNLLKTGDPLYGFAPRT